MGVKNDEKEWVRRLIGNRHETQNKVSGHVDNTVRSNETKNGSKDNIGTSAGGDGTEVAAKSEGGGFDDVAGMEGLKQMVTESFINVLKNPECAKAYNISPPNMLFYGPAGCGKTFFAEAVAKELGINFVKVVPDDIASKWIHGTQEKIAAIFREAERNGPTVLFFDEFEAMVPRRRDDDHASQNGEVNEFLCMLNNAHKKNIYVIAATNHPEMIDRAILRTGRIDEIIYVDIPDKNARESLFRLSLSKLPSDKDIDYGKLADLTQGFNCSDIDYIIKVASRNMFNASIREKNTPYQPITQAHLEEVIARRTPSVTSRDLREFERLRSEFSPKDAGVKSYGVGFVRN